MNMAGLREAIIFDGDDTLWQTQRLYDKAKEQLFSSMQAHGYPNCDFAARFAAIDVANVAAYGLAPERFATSMVDFYRALSEERGDRVDAYTEDWVWHLGLSVVEQSPDPMEDAPVVLSRLRDRFRLVLYTAGVPWLQQRRIEQLGFGHLFDATYVRERKTQVELTAILREQCLAIGHVWVVGNSLRSDINPALALGLRCIWMQGGSWEYDHDVPLPGAVREISRLRDLPAIVLGAGIAG